MESEEGEFEENAKYSDLLRALQPCSNSSTKAHKKRKRKESKKEKGDIDIYRSHKTSVEEEEETTAQELHTNDFGNEVSMSDDLKSHSDEVDVIETKGLSPENDLEQPSSYNLRLGHNLSEKEVKNLLENRSKYEWEVPAVGMSRSKWIGTGENFLKDLNLGSFVGLKPKLHKHWLDMITSSGAKDINLSKQRMFFFLCNSYRDILHCQKRPFYFQGHEDSIVMDSYIMHSLNHIFRTKDLVTKNDAKVAKLRYNSKDEIVLGDSFLDQGFTRPKVLILLPLESIAFRVVKRLIQLTPSSHKVTVEHINRFQEQFGNEEIGENEGESQHGPDSGTGKSQKTSKPSDFEALFGGKKGDAFMLGIKFSKKSIKLFNDFYTSDIIIASPLGLVHKIEEAEQNKEKLGYLSSIEVLIIDHADVITMQNWSHLETVVKNMNDKPSERGATDFLRIRPWYRDGYSKFYRQTIVLSYYLNPDINAFFNHHCLNYQGKIKLVCEYKGVLQGVLPEVRQIYERLTAESVRESDGARFNYFVKKVFPKIKESDQGGIMVFISSYYDFIRVRNFLKAQNASFSMLHEYSTFSDISRARLWFFEGKSKIMLYTERFHFFFRYKIRGVKDLIMYSLPERKDFYPEIVNKLDGSHDMHCFVMFTRFDLLRLERIVGSAAAKRMISSEKNCFCIR